MIKRRNAVLVTLLLFVPLVEAQEVPELLRAVDAGKAQQLIEYNSPWLQAELYTARRFRIVTVDSSPLMNDDDFVVTLFDDRTRLRLTAGSIQRREDTIAWNAVVLGDLPEVLRSRGATQTVLFSAVAWDTDEAGRAAVSFDNRFQFSPKWTFDFFDRPVLAEGDGLATGPPPQTPEEVARHKELLKLNKYAFYSVNADFEMLFPRVTCRLVPLKHTPKYHVLFEVDPEKVVPVLTDREPGEDVERTPAEQVKLSNYEDFLRSLPPDRDVPVVEELP
jgi:hypothetical protein